MRARLLYPTLVLLIAVLGAVVGLRLVSPVDRIALWVGLIGAVVVQGPLGWWVIRAVGTPRFVTVWGLGLAGRVALLGVAALVIRPAFGLAGAPLLLTLAGVLTALLVVEGIVALVETSRT